jgi:hypothetical protein
MPASLLLNDALGDALADAVRRAVPVETAVEAAGISHQQFYAWLRAAQSGLWPDGSPVSPDSLATITAFAEKIRRAQAEAEAEHVGAIAEAGTIVGKNGVPEWRARAWLLNNHPRYRERYRQHRETTVNNTGIVQHEHRLVRELEGEELERAYAALEQLPPPSP